MSDFDNALRVIDDLVDRVAELKDALRRIVEIGSGPPDREMPPADHWLPALNTCVQIAEEALEDD